jgi:hypothetical protein
VRGRCLEGILGVLLGTQDTTAQAQDHWPMPPKQHRERGLVAGGGETFEESRVRQIPRRVASDGT